MSQMRERLRVLVVEDDEAIREILRLSLIDDGYEVTVANNGEIAIASMQQWPPDLIVLDMMMPVMDGATFRRRQRELGLAPQARLVVLSASRTAVPQAAQLGADANVPKPFELEELLSVITETLQSSSVSSARRA